MLKGLGSAWRQHLWRVGVAVPGAPGGDGAMLSEGDTLRGAAPGRDPSDRIRGEMLCSLGDISAVYQHLQSASFSFLIF